MENSVNKDNMRTLKEQLRVEILQDIAANQKPTTGIMSRAIKQFSAVCVLTLAFYSAILLAGDIRERLRFKDGELLSADKLEQNFNQLHKLTPPVGTILA